MPWSHSELHLVAAQWAAAKQLGLGALLKGPQWWNTSGASRYRNAITHFVETANETVVSEWAEGTFTIKFLQHDRDFNSKHSNTLFLCLITGAVLPFCLNLFDVFTLRGKFAIFEPIIKGGLNMLCKAFSSKYYIYDAGLYNYIDLNLLICCVHKKSYTYMYNVFIISLNVPVKHVFWVPDPNIHMKEKNMNAKQKNYILMCY